MPAWPARNRTAIQIVPDDQVHPGLEFPFALLLFKEPALPGLVYIENFTKTLHLEGQADVDQYTAAFEVISHTAMTPQQSQAVIRQQIGALGN